MSEPQSAKNIDPKAREIAKDLARRSGMTLGEWLTQMIVEGDAGSMGGQMGGHGGGQQQNPQHHQDAEDLPQPQGNGLFGRQPGESYYWRRPESPRANYVDPSYSDRLYGQGGRAEPAAGYEDDLARITRALERMSGRIEAAEQRANLSVTSVDQSVMGLMARLENTERNQTSIAARLEGDLESIRSSQAKVSAQLKRMEEDGDRGGRNFEALRSLEGALSKLAAHLYENEAKAKDSIIAIEEGLRSLSGRVDEKISTLAARIEDTLRDGAHEGRAVSSEVGQAIARITERLEQSEGTTGASLKALEDALAALEARQGSVSAAEVEAVVGRISARLEQSEANTRAALQALEARPNGITAQDVEAVVGRIGERLEQSEANTRAALQALESRQGGASAEEVAAAVAQITERLERSEAATAAALRALEDRQTTDSATADNGVVDRITERLQQSEAATNASLKGLESSIAVLEERLRSAEAKGTDEAALAAVEERFNRLSRELAEMVAGTRAELVEKIETTAANTDFGRIDAAIGTLNRHIEDAESRSAGAIDRLADEVARIAGAVDKRISLVEGQSATAIETISNEVGKIADAIDSKFRASETKNVEAIERLGAEFARISDRLTERLVSAERRSTIALDQVGEEVGKISERLTQRYERAAADLAERLRASEQRTQSMFEDIHDRVNQRLDQKFAEADRRTSDTLSPVTRTVAALATKIDTAATTAAHTLSAQPETPAYEPPVAQPLSIKAQGRYELPVSAAFAAMTPAADSLADADSATVVAFAPQTPAAADADTPHEAIVLPRADDVFADDEVTGQAVDITLTETDLPTSAMAFTTILNDVEDAEPGMDALQPTTAPDVVQAADAEPLPIGATAGRDFLAQARQAMRVVGNEKDKPGKKANKKADKRAKTSLPDAAEADAEAVRASAAFATHIEHPMRSAAFDTLPPLSKKDSKAASSSRVVAVGGMAVAAAAGAAYVTMTGGLDDALNRLGVSISNPVASTTSTVTVNTDNPTDSVLTVSPITKATPSPDSLTPDVVVSKGSAAAAPATAVASAPAPVAASAPVATPSATPAAASTGDALITQYQSGLKLLTGGDAAAGAALVKKAADGGLAEAQYKLATLYEGGKGVPESMTEAYSWNERAAQGGNRKAMHNMGLYHYYGDGVAQSYEKAAQWFIQAAERGSTDSQFNLGLLYEQGYGVMVNKPEAYKWFSVAAKSGDAQARKKADELAPNLRPEDLRSATAAAAGFKPKPVDARANGQF